MDFVIKPNVNETRKAETLSVEPLTLHPAIFYGTFITCIISFTGVIF